MIHRSYSIDAPTFALNYTTFLTYLTHHSLTSPSPLAHPPPSPTTTKQQDLKVVHEDDQIVVVDKPAGVLSTPGRDGNPSLQQAVFDAFGCESGNANKMACHRLGMDTSGLMIFAKTDAALRDLNAQFRTRKVRIDGR